MLESSQARGVRSDVTERIAILNHPCAPSATSWSREAVEMLRELGFTAVQVNIGWGWRPADEALNLEDIVRLHDSTRDLSPNLDLLSDGSRLDERRSQLAERIQLCQEAGLKTAFNFGAPYNQHQRFGGTPPNCLVDESVIGRYEALLGVFFRDFPVDYLWLYTYDQDAWLCSEFGDCPRCAGRPLHERLVPFLNRLTARWHDLNPTGRLWWEPWELSGGQVLRILERVEPEGFGLALHNNVAECMVAMPSDPHVRNFARQATSRGIPVTLEGFFGAASEEVEPYVALQSPLTTYRHVRNMMGVEGVTGVKEYFGIDISQPDPNLEAATLCFRDPDLTDREVLHHLSARYGDSGARAVVESVWELASEAMDLHPWDASWAARRVGLSDPRHSLEGAFIRGFCADTPAWRSTRGATFIMTDDDSEPHPWLLEDVQLRWEVCAEKQREAIELGTMVVGSLPDGVRRSFEAFMFELREFRRRILAFAYHCRETNLTRTLRKFLAEGAEPPQSLLAELAQVLKDDQLNMESDDLDEAIDMLRSDPQEFARAYFLPAAPLVESRGYNSVTSP